MILRSIQPFLLALVLTCAACSAPESQVSPTPIGPLSSSQTATPAASATAIPDPAPVTPTIAPTLPPPPRDFTEAFDFMPAYWSFRGVDNGALFAGPSTRDGFLAFDFAVPDQWAYALYTGRDYADVTVEAEIQIRTPGDGAGGVVCRYDPNRGWYEFNIYADQTYQLLFGQWLAPGVARYVPLFQGQSENLAADANRIALQCQGSTLTPFINGVQLRRWPEQKFGLQKGQSGLSAASFQDAPFTIAFDWMKVSEP